MPRLSAVFLLFFLGIAVSPSRGLAQDPDFRKYYEIAVGHFQKNEYDAAIENFQKALEKESNPAMQAKIYNLIGLAYMKQDVSPQSALGSFEQAVKLDPKFAEPYFNIASVYASKNMDSAKAVEYFEKTIQVDPNYTKAYFGLGWFTLMQKQDAETALKYFQKTLATFPDFAEAHYGIGLAYIRMQKYHMVLGSVSQLRSMGRDDLATTLEQTVNQITAETAELAEKKSSAQNPAAQKSSSAPAAAPARRGRSPFEVIMKGKMAAPKPDASKR